MEALEDLATSFQRGFPENMTPSLSLTDNRPGTKRQGENRAASLDERKEQRQAIVAQWRYQWLGITRMSPLQEMSGKLGRNWSSCTQTAVSSKNVGRTRKNPLRPQ